MPLRVIHPGKVKSQTDGDIHYIGFAQLIRLYKFNPFECVLYSPHFRYPEDARHYYPKFNGNYESNEGD